MSLFGQSYEEYTNLYASGSSPIVPSDKYLGIITVLLIIVGKLKYMKQRGMIELQLQSVQTQCPSSDHFPGHFLDLFFIFALGSPRLFGCSVLTKHLFLSLWLY